MADSCTVTVTSRSQTRLAVSKASLKICKTRSIIPNSCPQGPELVRVGKICCGRGFAVVCDGEYLGCPVAIKYLRTSVEDSDRASKVPPVSLVSYPPLTISAHFTQSLVREIIAWKHRSHPNILPLLGFTYLRSGIASIFSPSGRPTGM